MGFIYIIVFIVFVNCRFQCVTAVFLFPNWIVDSKDFDFVGDGGDDNDGSDKNNL